MPNIKFTELSSTTELLATEDRLPFVDISDDAMGASGTNKTIDSTRLSESVATLMPDNKLSGLKLVNATLTADKLSLGAPSWTSAGDVSIGDGIANANLVVTFGKDRVSNGSTSLQLFSNNALIPTSTLIKDAGENSNLNISNVGSGNIIMTQNGTGSIVLSTGNGERMRIASDGNIGIGKSNPGTPLDVQGTITATSLVTPNITLDSSGIVFEGSTADNFETTLTVVNPTADRTITLPNVTGTVVTTGDTGTVSSTMIADGTIVNADISASAAIAGTKINPSFGGQTIRQDGASVRMLQYNGSSVAVTDFGIGTLTGDQSSIGLNVANSTGVLALGTNSAERMRITASGNVGIGKTDPATALDVNGTVQATAFIGAIPSGAIMAFAMSTAPSGWLAANGDTIPNGSGTVQGKTANFAELYSLIGTTYGSAGKLPDLRGYFVRGSGTNSDGTASGTFGAKQSHMFQTHGHSASSNSAGDHTHSTGQTGTGTRQDAPLSSGTTYVIGNGGTSTGTAGAHSHTITVSSPNSGTSGNETRPSNIAMLYCIKI